VIDMNACEVFPLSALENDAAELSGVDLPAFFGPLSTYGVK
jgi:hypothetical protein